MTSEALNIDGTRVWRFSSAAGVLGFLGIDSEINGRSCGGLRYLPDVDAREIGGLARAMTLKYGFLGISQGGAKAGIVSVEGESREDRERRLAEFGRVLAPWLKGRKYFPGTDMGVNVDDLGILLEAAGVKLRPWRLGCRLSGLYTATTVFAGIAAVCRRKNKPLDCCTFALEGFGAVGGSLAEFIHGAGGKVVALSTSYGAVCSEEGLDIPSLLARRSQGETRLFAGLDNARSISPSSLKALPVDILCPCARHDSVTAVNAPLIQAWALVPGANNPVTPEAEEILQSRGVICLPDFVTNSGGVLGGTMAFAGIRSDVISRFILDSFPSVYTDLFLGSEKEGISIREYAARLSLERHRRVKSASERKGAAGRILEAGLSCYRAGLIPQSLMGRISLPYFRKLAVFKGYQA